MRFTFPHEQQLDTSDCGPACIKIIAKYYGKYLSLHTLREQCNVTKDGCTLKDVSQTAESAGFRTLPVRGSDNELREKIQLPCIAYWKWTHFIVVYKVKKNRVYVSDPASGLVTYTAEEFCENWCGDEERGVLLVLEPGVQFHEGGNKKPADWKNRIFNYFRPYSRAVLNLLVIMLIVTGLQGLLPFISKSIIDVGVQTRDLNFLQLVLIANLVIVIGLTLSNIVRDWILRHITNRVNIALISDYLFKLLRLPLSFFENRSVGDILQRGNDHERIRSFIMNNSLNMVFSGLTFLVFSIILLFYNSTVFFIFFTGSVLYVTWILLFMRSRKKMDSDYFELISKNQSYWVETISTIQDIKINNYQNERRWKWEAIQSRLFHVNNRLLSINSVQSVGSQFIDNIKNLAITFFCAHAVIKGEITFGIMISIQFITGMLNAPVIQLISFIISGQYAKISFQRLNEIHEMEDEEKIEGVNSIELPENRSIALQSVSFKYTGSESFVLRNINMIIPHGKITAIIGDSGSGKTTLMKLLLRMYDPTFGQISIGSMNISNISHRQWRDNCGAVLQDGKIFNDTVLRNIVLGDENIDYERLKNVVQVANITHEIETLSKGYQTVLEESGKNLSGGQRQRILIARALYKQPEYLFFDEATNSLDTINERKIVANLNEVFRDKTVIIVAHRLSTIRHADQIIVMKGGSIVETGNHDLLLERKGHYYSLVHNQVSLTMG